MTFKEWLKSILGREPTEQEEAEGKKLVLPPTTEIPPTSANLPTKVISGVSDDAIMRKLDEVQRTNTALVEKLNAEEEARKKQTEQLAEKAKADHVSAVDAKIADAITKGLIPPENKELLETWKALLNADIDTGSKALFANTPITAGSPPASNQQNATGQVTNPAQAIQDIRQQAEAALSPKR